MTFGSSNPVEELKSLTCVFGSLGFNARQGTTYSIEMKKGELRFFVILFLLLILYLPMADPPQVIPIKG